MIPILSIVAPVYNEAEGLIEFVRCVRAAIDPLGISWELLLVNDGSTDATLQIARGLVKDHPMLRVISFSRNFGHEAASTAGLRFAGGRAVVLIDADLQDPPCVIQKMLEKWKEGYQIVYGVRATRHAEPNWKRAGSWLFYRIMRMVTSVDLPNDTGDFRLMDRRVVDAFNVMPERNRFVRGLIAWTGFRSTGLHFDRQPRFAGKSQYSFLRLFRLAIDTITNFTTTPLKIATWLGSMIATAAVLWILVVIYQFFFWKMPNGEPYRQPGYTFLAIAILLLGGVQIFLIGIVGEYLARTYEQVQGRPMYIVDDLVNFEPDPAAGSSWNLEEHRQNLPAREVE
jgi:glycosyltransferase involved in cell wall biosynthesis